MNTAAASESPPVTGVPLTRAAKVALLQKMYTLKHWIELIRLFGYQTLPMEQAREAIKPLAEKFGKEPVAAACEVLIEISTPGKEPVARLKPHVRHMAFQILGPEQKVDATPATDSSTPQTGSRPEEKAPEPAKPKKPKRPAKSLAPAPTSAELGAVSAPANGRASIMEQYRVAKERHPGMMLLFRMGDFYELFDGDAETAHKALGLTQTTRDRTVMMAGFPHHQLEAYLHKLLHAGHRVAICEPVEESLARGPIRREVTRVVTPSAMNEEDKAASADTGDPGKEPAGARDRPVRQPRHFVLKRCEAWFHEAGLAFVAM